MKDPVTFQFIDSHYRAKYLENGDSMWAVCDLRHCAHNNEPVSDWIVAWLLDSVNAWQRSDGEQDIGKFLGLTKPWVKLWKARWEREHIVDTVSFIQKVTEQKGKIKRRENCETTYRRGKPGKDPVHLFQCADYRRLSPSSTKEKVTENMY